MMQMQRLNARHPFAVRTGAGMGSEHYLAVQQGEDGSFRRFVMVKKLSSLLRDEARAEMLREVRAAASLSHPNVVRVFGAERSGGQFLISMEYIRGYGLGEILDALRASNKEVPLGVLIRLMMQACEALDYAQRAVDIRGEPLGLIHRNISPESLKLDEEGYLRVIDFGLSTFAHAEDATLPGQVKGSLAYMPLEQMRGHPLDIRSDIFCLAMTFYEAFTLEAPRKARNIKAAFDEALEMASVGKLSEYRTCPDELEAIFAKATSREPEERYDSGRALYRALEKLADCGLAPASVFEVRTWVLETFPEMRARREQFEREFIAAIEDEERTQTSAGFGDLSVPGESDKVDGASEFGAESVTSRWVIYSAIAFVGVMALSAVFVASTYSTSGRVTEGFYVGESEDAASVFVLSRPAQAAVSLDGEFIGHTTQLGMTIVLEAGRTHRISLTRVGFEPFEETILGSSGTTQRLIAKLTPITPKVKSHELQALPKGSAAVTSPSELPELVEEDLVEEPELPSESLLEEPVVAVEKPDMAEPTPLPAEEVVIPREPAPTPSTEERGLRAVTWGMKPGDVSSLEAGRTPVKVSDRMMSYSGNIFGERAWLNYIFVDEGLKGVIYLLNQTAEGSIVESYIQVRKKLEAALGRPNEALGDTKQGKVLTWFRDTGEVKLVLSRKRKAGRALKIMDLSMSWEDFQVEVGSGAR